MSGIDLLKLIKKSWEFRKKQNFSHVFMYEYDDKLHVSYVAKGSMGEREITFAFTPSYVYDLFHGKENMPARNVFWQYSKSDEAVKLCKSLEDAIDRYTDTAYVKIKQRNRYIKRDKFIVGLIIQRLTKSLTEWVLAGNVKPANTPIYAKYKKIATGRSVPGVCTGSMLESFHAVRAV